MDLQDKTKQFLLTYIGISDLSSKEQETIFEYLWNAVNARIFDLLREHLDDIALLAFEDRFENEKDAVISEIKELCPEFDELSKRATIEVIEEFRAVRNKAK